MIYYSFAEVYNTQCQNALEVNSVFNTEQENVIYIENLYKRSMLDLALLPITIPGRTTMGSLLAIRKLRHPFSLLKQTIMHPFTTLGHTYREGVLARPLILAPNAKIRQASARLRDNWRNYNMDQRVIMKQALYSKNDPSDFENPYLYTAPQMEELLKGKSQGGGIQYQRYLNPKFTPGQMKWIRKGLEAKIPERIDAFNQKYKGRLVNGMPGLPFYDNPNVPEEKMKQWYDFWETGDPTRFVRVTLPATATSPTAAA